MWLMTFQTQCWTVIYPIILHKRSLQVGHHLDVDIIHPARAQTVQFNTAEHAARQQINKSQDFTRPETQFLKHLLYFLILPFPIEGISNRSIQ